MNGARVIVGLVTALGRAAAAQTPAADTVREPGRTEYQAADSIVLERGPCFGTCPVYRVSISRSGDVHFVLLSRPDSGRIRQRHIDPQRFSDFMGAAATGRFFSLPDVIARDPKYCPTALTDLPSATLSIFLPKRQKTISDYYGCVWAPQILRSLEETVDEMAGTRPWVR